MGNRTRLAVCATLLAMTAATTAHAAAPEQFSLEMTYTGAGDLTQTRLFSCYDSAGNYQRDVVSTWHSQVQWTTIYAPTFFLPPGAKQLPTIQLGQAEYDTHQLAGTYDLAGSPCLKAGSGTLADVDGANQVDPHPYMPMFGILHGKDVEFRLSAGREPGETDRNRMFANQYSSVGYSRTNWVADKGEPDLGGGLPVYSLTGIFTVSLAQLRDLEEGRKASLELDVAQPTLPGFVAQPPAGGTVAATMAGHVKIVATCIERVKTGTGYAALQPEMKRALTKLYKELDRQKACYRFTIGYRSKDTQKKLYDKWHAIADKQGPGDHRSSEQVCAAVRAAHFAQCPQGYQGNVAKGGPAVPGTSRHEHGEAADITVRFPPLHVQDLAKYQAAARKAGLCGPPKADAVHVELPYAKAPGKPVRCQFPPGPAP
jgi:hypothetical protein